MNYPKVILDKCSGSGVAGMEVGHRHFKLSGVRYNVGDILKPMKFYISEKEYYEGAAKVTSTNVRNQTVSFKGVGVLDLKKEIQ